MKTNQWKKIWILAGSVAMAGVSCSDGAMQKPVAEPPPELVFTVDGLSRATVDYPLADYFGDESGSLHVDVTAGDAAALYEYQDGLLVCVSDQKITFPGTGAPIPQVDLTWPAGYEYKADQRAKRDFLTSDRLVCGFANLMPSNRVAVLFDHADYKLTFTAVDKDAGRKIESLYVDAGQVTYYAFCDAGVVDAQLIVPAGTNLGGLSGVLTFEDQTENPFTIATYTVAEAVNQNITVNVSLK